MSLFGRAALGGDFELVRISTAGSVDDGKSTLIGRLLYDSKAIPDDQYEAVRQASEGAEGGINLALITDGLRAEREQMITIDVAYRYFSTEKRRFIIADTPGHQQYTRNMVTGASTADVAIILADARKGLLTQSRRHSAIASLLRVPKVVVAVNKMDLVGFEEQTYKSIVKDFSDMLNKLGVEEADFIPISALLGDNVVEGSANMPWYSGPSILGYLDNVHVEQRSLAEQELRLPVQVVLRPNQDYRGFAGQVEAGTVAKGDPVLIHPSGKRTIVTEVNTPDGPVTSASVGASVSVRLADEIDASRGSMIVSSRSQLKPATQISANICWMSETPSSADKKYRLAHTTREVPAQISAINYLLEIESMERQEIGSFGLNDLGSVTLSLAQPIFADRYEDNRNTGSFLLIDPETNVPVAGGMITDFGNPGESDDLPDELKILAQGVFHVNEGKERALRYEKALHQQGRRAIAVHVNEVVDKVICQELAHQGLVVLTFS